MKLVVEPSVLELFPQVMVGVLVARDVDNRATEDERPALERRLAAAQRAAVASLGGASVTEHPRIACWREAYRRFGAKPKKYPSSIENLVRRAMKGEPLGHINRLVDLGNVVSLMHLLPLGGEDLDRIEGDLRLTRAGEAEPPVRLLGESEARPPKPGEVFYRDDAGAVCRRWNWKEADRTKLTEATARAVLVVEALAPIRREELLEALDALAGLVRETCGGEVSEALLDRDRTEVDLV